MMTVNAMPQDGNYEKHYITAVLDDEARDKARELFNEYRKCGVILNGSYSDLEWRLTNQLHNISISFYFSELGYRKYAASWVGCDYPLFIDSVKAYAMFRLGGAAISSIREMVNSFRLIVDTAENEFANAASGHSCHLADLLAALPGGSIQRDAMLEALEETQRGRQEQNGKRMPRVLSGLGTYFKFNDAMQDLWESAEGAAKLYWFPLYLWWTLTAILPLRTTEFLLTPRECLSYEHGKILITLRRTMLKGNGRKFAYRIDRDYETVRYVIPEKMAEEIRQYLKDTGEMAPASLSTLFVQAPHYAKYAKKPLNTLGYYTYTNLSTCLRNFQEGVMSIPDESRIHLGDTRHLAMISLILSGGSPLVCKELAGHADINVSAHYYSNISSFIECAVFEAHRKSRIATADMTERKILMPNERQKRVPVQDGFCSSEAYMRGEIYDCIKSISIGGEIGCCQRCNYYFDGDSGVRFLYANPAERKKQVDEDSLYLLQAVESVRRGIGLQEDIQSALLRLQQSGLWYGRSLKNELEADGYGKTEKNDN